jgi:ATP-binding cassette, subfamily B, bacterial
MSALSLLAGVLEAVLLVLVVTSALAVADGRSTISLDLPLLGMIDPTPGVAIAIAAIAGVFVLTLHIAVAHLGARLAAGVLQTTRDRLIDAFADATWERQAKEREGSLQESATSLSTQTADLANQLAAFVTSMLGLSAFLLTAVAVDPVATAIVLLVGATLVGIFAPIRRATRMRARSYVERNSRLAEQMSQWGTLAMEFRMFGVHRTQADRLSVENEHTTAAFRRTRVTAQLGATLFRDLAILFLVGAVGVLYLAGDVDLGAVGSVVILIVRSMSYAQGAQAAMQHSNERSPHLDTLIERLESLEAARATAGTTRLASFHEIALHDVSYAYEPGTPAVDGLTLTLHAGESLGVIGPSGGGKTTLMQLLLRLRTPTSGTVCFDGHDYTEIDDAAWSRIAALVPQEPRLFRGTVAENIRFLRPDIDRETIEQAAADAHVLDDILRMPDGFDTELGPRGDGLSGGQKQRITIARALAGKPHLLVLDEPTSALDVRSEQLLQETIPELHGRVTLVIVAHRVSTLTICDRVLAMDGGRVVTVGSLDDALTSVSFTQVRTDQPS